MPQKPLEPTLVPFACLLQQGADRYLKLIHRPAVGLGDFAGCIEGREISVTGISAQLGHLDNGTSGPRPEDPSQGPSLRVNLLVLDSPSFGMGRCAMPLPPHRPLMPTVDRSRAPGCRAVLVEGAQDRIITRRMRERPWRLSARARRACCRSHRRCDPWARSRTPRTRSGRGYTTRRSSSAQDRA